MNRLSGSIRLLRQRAHSDEGSILLLAMFSGLLCLLIVLGVTVATSLYLERKRLFTVADGAATAAAEAFSLEDVTFAGGKILIQLTDEQARAEAINYLSVLNQPGSLPLHLVSATANDGRSATVVVAAGWKPPVVSLFFPQGIELSVSATARTVFG